MREKIGKWSQNRKKGGMARKKFAKQGWGSKGETKDVAYRRGSREANELALMLELDPSDGLGEYVCALKAGGHILDANRIV